MPTATQYAVGRELAMDPHLCPEVCRAGHVRQGLGLGLGDQGGGRSGGQSPVCPAVGTLLQTLSDMSECLSRPLFPAPGLQSSLPSAHCSWSPRPREMGGGGGGWLRQYSRQWSHPLPRLLSKGSCTSCQQVCRVPLLHVGSSTK